MAQLVQRLLCKPEELSLISSIGVERTEQNKTRVRQCNSL